MSTLISAGQVLTGTTRIPDGAILVDGDRIVAVGPRRELETAVPSDATRLAFPGGTALPGLIDCHVHLAFDGSSDLVTAVTSGDAETRFAGMASRAAAMLGTGVTTVRDLGDRDALAVRLRDEIAAGRLPGPRILAATAPLTLPGGYCWFLGGEVDGVDAIRAQVIRNAEAGADVIKVMATGGHLTPGSKPMWESQFSARELRVVVAAATEYGLPVAAHAHGTEGITMAVEAGVSTIEHCTWLSAEGFDVRDDVVATIVAEGIAVCPALSNRWRDYPRRFGADAAELLFRKLAWADAVGVHLAAGTDAGIPEAPFDDIVGALEVFVHAGFPNGRILHIATRAAAEAIGLGDTTGRLAPGYAADVLVVDGDPLTDLTDLRDVRLVLARGTQFGGPGRR